MATSETILSTKCGKNTEGEIFVQLLTVIIEHTIHQCHCISSQDKKKDITDSIPGHVEYIFWGVTDIRKFRHLNEIAWMFHGSKQWVINLRREDIMSYSTEKLNKQYTVCMPITLKTTNLWIQQWKNRLIHKAVPTIFDIPNPPLKLTPKP